MEVVRDGHLPSAPSLSRLNESGVAGPACLGFSSNAPLGAMGRCCSPAPAPTAVTAVSVN